MQDHIEKINKETNQNSNKGLRLGKHIDEGNADFLNFGYGGERSITVDRLSIAEVKNYLTENNILTRP